MNLFTRVSALADFAEFASSQQLKPEQMLREAGISLQVLHEQEGLISYPRFAALLESCAERSGNPLFGLQYGLFQGINIFGSLLYLVRNATDVSEALKDLSRYYHVHDNVGGVLLERQGQHSLLSYTALDDNMPGQRQINELAMGVGQQLMRTLLGSRWQPEHVLFKHAPMAPLAQYRRLLGVIPKFNTPYQAWMFDSALLDIPLSDADKALHRLIQQHLDSVSELHVNELPDYIRRLLRNFLPGGRVTIDTIADFMQLSPRTLQRHLAESDSSFQVLLDETRESMSEHYLRDSQVSMAQLSELLGYSDQSAFSRAFQRWKGMTPRQWLKSQPKATISVPGLGRKLAPIPIDGRR